MAKLDRFAIDGLQARYADGVARRAEEAWSSCWEIDAVWLLRGDTELRGRESIRAAWLEAMQRYRWVTQMWNIGDIAEVEPGVVEYRLYLREAKETQEGRFGQLVGIYHDRVRLNERAVPVYLSRRLQILHEDPI